MRTFVIVGFVVTLGLVVVLSSKQKSETPPMQMTWQRTPASTPPTRDGSALERKQAALKEIERVESCYHSNACDYPQTDSRSYSFAAGKALAEKLARFHAQYRKDPSARQDLELLARRAFKVEDGYVQSVALDIFKDLPISKENLDAFGEALKDNTDPLVAEKALNELQRYMNTPEEPQMQAVVQEMLGGGAHFASQKVGEHILNFINDRSFAAYQRLQRQLPPQSRVARDLNTALREYRRQRAGG